MQSPTITPAELAQAMRQAMRRLASSVAVVTARDETARHAMAATSVTSVSLDPPSLLVCVNRSASIYPALAAGHDFAVNILSGGHEALSIACGGGAEGEGRFGLGEWADEPESGTPLLRDAQASLICATDATYHYGTHGIFIGKVKRVQLWGEAYPLIYFNGRYASLREETQD